MDVTTEMARRNEEVGTDPAPRELVRRAQELRPMLREQQDAAEERGHYGEEVHDALRSADLYRILTPKRYGGLELDLSAYARVVIEISRGDPATGWCYSLGHNHNLTTAAHFSVQAQEEVFNNPVGYFRSSHSVAGDVQAVKADGGYRLTGSSPYQSGVPYSVFSTVNATVPEVTGPDGAPIQIAAIIPRDQVEVLDDWHGDATLGLRASGSNTVVVKDVFVPEHLTTIFDWPEHDYTEPSAGSVFHDNPMYLGPVAGFFHLALVTPIIGAAKAAVDEYEQIITTRTMPFPPFTPRSEDPHHQADLGMAMTMADTAEAIAIRMCDQYMEYCEDTVKRGIAFTTEMDTRLYGMIQRAGQLASEAVQLLFNSAGSTAAKRGNRMQRYFRDVAMYRGHMSSQYQWTAMKLAQIHFGLRKSPF